MLWYRNYRNLHKKPLQKSIKKCPSYRNRVLRIGCARRQSKRPRLLSRLSPSLRRDKIGNLKIPRSPHRRYPRPTARRSRQRRHNRPAPMPRPRSHNLRGVQPQFDPRQPAAIHPSRHKQAQSPGILNKADVRVRPVPADQALRGSVLLGEDMIG